MRSKKSAVSAISEDRYRQVKKVSLIAAVFNLFLGLLKFIMGCLGGSTALVADGLHSFSDIIADLFVILASKFSKHEADEDHPYGHRRIETLGTFAIGFFLVFIGIGIGYEAFYLLWTQGWNSAELKPEFYTIWIAIFSVIGNEILFFYTLNVGKKINSELLIANAYHSRGDSLTGMVVLVGLIGAQLGFPFLDKMAAILIALYLIKMGVGWGIRALSELVDVGLRPERLQAIETKIHQTPGVIKSHLLRTRKMADQVFLDVHIQVNPYLSVSEGHYIGESVRMRLGKAFPELFDITVHIDIDEHVEGIPNSLPPSSEVLKSKLQEVWKAYLKPEDLVEIRVHYFSTLIQVEAKISLHAFEAITIQDLENVEKTLIEEAKKVPEISTVFIVFRGL